jgi:molybdopterin/thiamine biosynthesis adenylyltransferase
MKVIILKQSMDCLSSFKKSGKPLNLYGFIRKTEELSYVFGIGNRVLYYPLIGQISHNGSVPANLRLVGMLQEGKLAFYYKRNSGWQRAEHHIVDYNDSFKRTPFPENLMTVLKNSCVTLFGLGSMGSRLAIGLVRAGIGKFKLIDPDTFEIENNSRHECNLHDIGRSKVKAVKERILKINPFVKVETYPFDVFRKSNSVLDKVFQNINLVIATTDKTAVQLSVNYECWNRRIPALFSGCYEEARGGEVLYTIPGETSVCLECLRGALQQPDQKREYDYSNAQSSEEYKGEPGLNAAINLITDVTQQYAIALLLRNENCEIAKMIDPKQNLLLIGGALGKGFYFFKKPFHFIQPKLKGPWKDCGTCQNIGADTKVS